jgi:uncharacterized protein with HEPN domain
MQPEDRVRIGHMIEAGEHAVRFTAGRSRPDLDSDHMLLFALVRAIEIVGEAASKPSPALRSETDQIPWGLIISMRNRLIHAYFNVDPDIVWKTTTEELPAVLPQLRALFQRDRDSEENL